MDCSARIKTLKVVLMLLKRKIFSGDAPEMTPHQEVAEGGNVASEMYLTGNQSSGCSKEGVGFLPSLLPIS